MGKMVTCPECRGNPFRKENLTTEESLEQANWCGTCGGIGKIPDSASNKFTMRGNKKPLFVFKKRIKIFPWTGRKK